MWSVSMSFVCLQIKQSLFHQEASSLVCFIGLNGAAWNIPLPVAKSA